MKAFANNKRRRKAAPPITNFKVESEAIPRRSYIGDKKKYNCTSTQMDVSVAVRPVMAEWQNHTFCSVED